MINFNADPSTVWVAHQLATFTVPVLELFKDLVSDFVEFFSFDFWLSEIEQVLILLYSATGSQPLFKLKLIFGIIETEADRFHFIC